MKRVISTLAVWSNALIAWGPVGVFLLAVLDSVGLPVVSGVDVLVVTLAARAPNSAYLTAGLAVAGSIAGSLVLFLIARRGGEAYFERHAQKPRGAPMKRWFLEYGLLTVFVPALVPIPMPLKLFVIAAGAFQVSPIVFTVVLALARIPRYFGLAWLGKRLGPETLPYLKGHIWQLLLFSAALFIALYLLIRFVDRRRKLRKLVSDPG